MLVVIAAVAPRMFVVPPVVLAIVITFAITIVIALAMSVTLSNNATGRQRQQRYESY
jgi:NADH:ubiquinone oxidoreductase subunit 3 (subunit A)